MKTPTRDEMITKIYESMARKDLSFGCRLKYGKENALYLHRESGNHYIKWEKELIVQKINIVKKIRWKSLEDKDLKIDKIYSISKYIIWHPVMIGDVMKWFIEKFWKYSDDYDMNISHNLIDLIHVWSVFDKPLEEQSDDCIRFIYDLMSWLWK